MAKKRENSQSIRVVSWEEYDKLVEKLLHNMDYEPESKGILYGIPRGGLIVATCLTHLEESFSLCLIDPKHNNLNRDRYWVIVDDIVDSGATARPYYDKAYTVVASLFYREGASFEPDYYAEKLDSDVWIKFPWERSV